MTLRACTRWWLECLGLCAGVRPPARLRALPPSKCCLAGAGLRARGPDDLRVGGATHSSPYSAPFSEVVCTLGVTPPQGAAPPPPIGGNCIIRAATHRRYTARQLLMLQIPHRHQSGGCRAASKTGAGRLARKKLAQHRPSTGTSAKKFAQQAQKHQISGVLSAQGELFRAFAITQRRRANFFAPK